MKTLRRLLAGLAALAASGAFAQAVATGTLEGSENGVRLLIFY